MSDQICLITMPRTSSSDDTDLHSVDKSGAAVSVSAPGKVLITGGYLVLEPTFTGLVVASTARFHAHASQVRLSCIRNHIEVQGKVYCIRSPIAPHVLCADSSSPRKRICRRRCTSCGRGESAVRADNPGNSGDAARRRWRRLRVRRAVRTTIIPVSRQQHHTKCWH